MDQSREDIARNLLMARDAISNALTKLEGEHIDRAILGDILLAEQTLTPLPLLLSESLVPVSGSSFEAFSDMCVEIEMVDSVSDVFRKLKKMTNLRNDAFRGLGALGDLEGRDKYFSAEEIAHQIAYDPSVSKYNDCRAIKIMLSRFCIDGVVMRSNCIEKYRVSPLGYMLLDTGLLDRMQTE